MTGLRRMLGLCVALAAFQAPAWASTFDEVTDTFKLGVDLLQRGKADEALRAFQKVLAMGPDQKAAYEIWRETSPDVWSDLLVRGGDMELVAKRLIELSRVERKERKNDPAAIQKLIDVIMSGDSDARRKALLTLSADHGEYAVPHLVGHISNAGNDDQRVLAMYALGQLNTEVVPALSEALRSDDTVLRRNIGLVLANIADPRSVGLVQMLAVSDKDEGVRRAAAEALADLKPQGDAATNLIAAGDAFFHGDDRFMREKTGGDVVWEWQNNQLNPVPIPRALYGSEMSKRAYLQALQAAPTSPQALAGLARAHVDLQARIDAMTAAGVDVGDWKDRAGQALQAVNLVGVDALDLALQQSVAAIDASTAAALARVIAPLAKRATPGLVAALKSSDGAIRSEAAVALGEISVRTGEPISADAVNVLAEATAREVMRVAVVIDPNGASSSAIASALSAQNVFVNVVDRGAKGLAILRRAPAVDVVLVADSLPDITTAQVVDEVRGDERLQATPVIVITSDSEKITGDYGDRIQGTVSSGVEDLKAVEAALSKELTGDRALAESLASRAADVLARLARSGRSEAGSAAALLASAVNRADKVAIPAMRALAALGGASEAGALGAVLVDSARSEEARAAAGNALGELLGRMPGGLDADTLTKIQAIAGSAETPRAIREAAARVLGSVQISPEERMELLRKL